MLWQDQAALRRRKTIIPTKPRITLPVNFELFMRTFYSGAIGRLARALPSGSGGQCLFSRLEKIKISAKGQE
jgi:hypothetical protein